MEYLQFHFKLIVFQAKSNLHNLFPVCTRAATAIAINAVIVVMVCWRVESMWWQAVKEAAPVDVHVGLTPAVPPTKRRSALAAKAKARPDPQLAWRYRQVQKRKLELNVYSF